MPAEVKPRINLADRTKLETVIPLSTPYLVFLDPSNLCNFSCSFCPTGVKAANSKRSASIMDTDLYRRILDDLCQMPEPIKILRLYGFGEPLINPNFPSMVEQAKTTGRFLQIDTTTNGSLLTQELNMQIIKSGLDILIVSVPANYSNAYVSNIAHFYTHSRGKCAVYVKIIKDEVGDKAAQFITDFEDISDRIFIENKVNCWPNFTAGPDGPEGIYGQALPAEVPAVCPYIFYSLTINSDGTVSACFLDWNRSLVVGDLTVQSFKAVWNGGMLRKMRLTHLLRHGYLYDSCGSCKQLQYGACDNIDMYAEEIWQHV